MSNKRQTPPCTCDQWPFPHRRDRHCEALAERRARQAEEERREQQAAWDRDRAIDFSNIVR